MYRLLVLFSFCPLIAQADPANVSVWDFGDIPGQIDSRDVVLDRSKSCADTSHSLVFPGHTNNTAQELSTLNANRQFSSAASVKEILSPIPVSDDAFGTVNVTDLNRGRNRQPVFVLLPEVHSGSDIDRLCTGDCGVRHYSINVGRTEFVAALAGKAVEAGHRVGNYREGLRESSYSIPSLNLEGINSPQDRYSRIYDEGFMDPFLCVANTFTSENVHSERLEEITEVGADYILSFGNFDQSNRFERFQMELIVSGVPRDAIDWESLRAAYDYLQSLSASEVERLKTMMCRDRSINMASRAINYSRQRGSSVVFIQFGASHYNGIAETLRNQGYSYFSVEGRSDLLEAGGEDAATEGDRAGERSDSGSTR